MDLYRTLVSRPQDAQTWITQTANTMLAFSLCSRSPPRTVVTISICSILLIYRPRKDERLSWLTYSGWFTHISGQLSAVGQAQNYESSPVKDQQQRSTTEPRNQPCVTVCVIKPNVIVQTSCNVDQHVMTASILAGVMFVVLSQQNLVSTTA